MRNLIARDDPVAQIRERGELSRAFLPGEGACVSHIARIRDYHRVILISPFVRGLHDGVSKSSRGIRRCEHIAVRCFPAADPPRHREWEGLRIGEARLSSLYLPSPLPPLFPSSLFPFNSVGKIIMLPFRTWTPAPT